MSISLATRQKLRQAVQNIEAADEIVNALDLTSTNYQASFTVGQWQSTDSGDTYSIDFSHNLGTIYPVVRVYEIGSEDVEVQPHKIKVINSNSVRVSVTQSGVDARFNGRVTIDK